ncbi:YdcF family protein [Phyllobacterium myrsinacearum]|uniref:Uncharacterized SAM-binding protein YcdF (DUF218 family) n=1 Tax=Phyllobacterium myrsinacearum TaxID=28101 RepID=A0A839ENA2_9HYPH|nr:YdcF family protein [Phyllobacterium myrsinacearum]MBA8878916.1 uncharacterized SAM-binding protein YcdF (DUF218 family) [Phyllobacterium myrsinacearum]
MTTTASHLKQRSENLLHHWCVTTLVLGVLVLSSYPLAIVFANGLLSVRNQAAKADVIVVLGGDGPSRAAQAARLWRDGLAPRILISGDGDCTWIRKTMIELGVDGGSISIECQSGNTWENALFSSPILHRMHVHRAILVTSWFHSRRALGSFERISSDIQWISIPVEPSVSNWQIAVAQDGIQIFKEYPKSLWYMLRYRLWKDRGTRDSRIFAEGMIA